MLTGTRTSTPLRKTATMMSDVLFTLSLLGGLIGGGCELLDLVGEAPREGTDAMLRVVGKGSKPRIVPVLPVVRAAIAAWLRLHPGAGDTAAALFVGVRGER